MLGPLPRRPKFHEALPDQQRPRGLGHEPPARHQGRLSVLRNHGPLLGHANAVRPVSIWRLQIASVPLDHPRYPGSHSARAGHDVFHQRLSLDVRVLPSDAQTKNRLWKVRAGPVPTLPHSRRYRDSGRLHLAAARLRTLFGRTVAAFPSDLLSERLEKPAAYQQSRPHARHRKRFLILGSVCSSLNR